MKTYNLPTLSSKADAVILANGDFPKHRIPLSILSDNPYIVCCDGAIDTLSEMGIEPQAVVGDCDSLSDRNKIRYAHIIHQIAEQETNDLTKSVRFCIDQGKKEIIILGATGKREDHSIANISLLCDYIEYTDTISMISDYGIFNAIKFNSHFQSFPGQQISLFCVERSEITTHGLKYGIEKRVFSNWWQTTLNESLFDNFSIETQGKTIVFRTF